MRLVDGEPAKPGDRMSEFVVIPVQGSQLDAKQAARQMKLIKAQERIANRPVSYTHLDVYKRQPFDCRSSTRIFSAAPMRAKP